MSQPSPPRGELPPGHNTTPSPLSSFHGTPRHVRHRASYSTPRHDFYGPRGTSAITSYGIVVARQCDHSPIGYEILAICRRNTMALSEMVRGKYTVHDKEYISRLMNNMTIEELTRLGSYKDFDDLWSDYWMDQCGVRRDHCDSRSKFQQLQSSGDLEALIAAANPSRIEPEWSFPKGRKLDFHEKEKDAAFREFEEETNYISEDIQLVREMPIVERFRGTNNLRYKCVYFLAVLRNPTKEAALEKPSQAEETSQIGWFSPSKLRELFGNETRMNKMWVMSLAEEFFAHYFSDHLPHGDDVCNHFLSHNVNNNNNNNNYGGAARRGQRFPRFYHVSYRRGRAYLVRPPSAERADHSSDTTSSGSDASNSSADVDENDDASDDGSENDTETRQPTRHLVDRQSKQWANMLSILEEDRTRSPLPALAL
jgi:8-oxo-dGTP pyrophosphatase MutT (NUDIX family)